MTLELKYLAPYLPYNLKLTKEDWGKVGELVPFIKNDLKGLQIEIDYALNTKAKPILRPLSDYLEDDSDAINTLGCDLSDQWMISELANKRTSLHNLNYSTILVMLEYHIDMFDLIPQGLAIDINDVSLAEC